jgi:histidinol-phosphatase (PHP family)
MSDMALASYEAGVKQVCFTDHCDLDHYSTGKPDYNCFDYWPLALGQYMEAVGKAEGKIDIRLGIELGAPNHDPQRASKIASTPDFDFVIGSLHNLRDTKDFYCLQYESEEHCHRLLDNYLTELIEIANMDTFDVLAHIGYTDRYMMTAGFDAHLDLNRYGDNLRVLLCTLIEHGHGIELNCSGWRHPKISGPIPNIQILKLYRELGGEIITIGSDAHMVSQAGSYLSRGLELLESIGFKYVATYFKRTAKFVKI